LSSIVKDEIKLYSSCIEEVEKNVDQLEQKLDKVLYDPTKFLTQV